MRATNYKELDGFQDFQDGAGETTVFNAPGDPARAWRGLVDYAQNVADFMEAHLPRPNGHTIAALAAQALKPIAPSAPAIHGVASGIGASFALRLAAARPGLFKSLVLIDPAEISLASTVDPDCGYDAMVRNMDVALTEGEPRRAASYFVDAWYGAGRWTRTSTTVQRALARQAAEIAAWMERISVEPMSDDCFASVVCPVLLISGDRAPNGAALIDDALMARLPFVRQFIVRGAGRAAHLSDPHVVLPAIADFLVRVDLQWQDAFVPMMRAA